jgi:hypothetical protein
MRNLPLLGQDAVEARVLAQVIADPDLLKATPDLELDDFQHPFLRAAFCEVRNLQANGAPFDAESVANAMALSDMSHDNQVDPLEVFCRLAAALLSAPEYLHGAFYEIWLADLRQLRQIAKSRRV